MCIRAYLVLQTNGEKPHELINKMLNMPGIVTVDSLEGSPGLLVLVEAEKRPKLVKFIVDILDSVEFSIKDLRFFIGRESQMPILDEVTEQMKMGTRRL